MIVLPKYPNVGAGLRKRGLSKAILSINTEATQIFKMSIKPQDFNPIKYEQTNFYKLGRQQPRKVSGVLYCVGIY